MLVPEWDAKIIVLFSIDEDGNISTFFSMVFKLLSTLYIFFSSFILGIFSTNKGLWFEGVIELILWI